MHFKTHPWIYELYLIRLSVFAAAVCDIGNMDDGIGLFLMQDKNNIKLNIYFRFTTSCYKAKSIRKSKDSLFEPLWPNSNINIAILAIW